MKAFKAFAILFTVIFAVSMATADHAQAQAPSSTFHPTANKIVYSTNAVEIQDSLTKLSYSFKKGTIIVVNKGYTGASVTLVEAHTYRRIWSGLIGAIRVVGVANNDSLKILSLKTTPF